MQVAEQATAPVSAAPCSEHNSLLKVITPEPEPSTTCAHNCSEGVNVYRMEDSWICLEHLAGAVSLAATTVWPDLVSYTQAFEDILWRT